MIAKIGEVECHFCGREWTAACECEETKFVECPDCGELTPIDKEVDGLYMGDCEHCGIQIGSENKYVKDADCLYFCAKCADGLSEV